MVNWNTVREWIISGLVQNFVWMIVAIVFVQYAQRAYEQWKYGRWRVIVLLKGKEMVDREISPGKVKEILSEPAEMSVFIKGVTSPYGWINCDVLTEGRRNGLFRDDHEKRQLLINMDLNPSSTNKVEGKKSPQKRRA